MYVCVLALGFTPAAANCTLTTVVAASLPPCVRPPDVWRQRKNPWGVRFASSPGASISASIRARLTRSVAVDEVFDDLLRFLAELHGHAIQRRAVGARGLTAQKLTTELATEAFSVKSRHENDPWGCRIGLVADFRRRGGPNCVEAAAAAAGAAC